MANLKPSGGNLLKLKVQAWSLLIGLPLFGILFLGGGGVIGTAAATQQTLRTLAQRSDVPPELKSTLKQLGTTWNADWYYLAALSAIHFNWRYPIKTRMDRYNEWEQQQEEKCREQQDGGQQTEPPADPGQPAPDPQPGDPPPDDPPPDQQQPCHKTPPNRSAIEAAWRADAAGFLGSQIQVVWGVSSPAEVQNRPREAFRDALQAWVPATEWKDISELHDVYEAWYSLYDDGNPKDLGEAVEWEDSSRLLSLLDWPYAFPVQGGPWDFGDDWGNDRPQNEGYASTRHHGTDIMAPIGTPLVAVDDCTVYQRGWNYLGGWAITLKCPSGADDVYFYYAHTSAYAPGTEEGARVKRGQVIAYVGNTGEGPEGHSGNFDPHLHFSIYLKPDQWTTDPYLYLLTWQK